MTLTIDLWLYCIKCVRNGAGSGGPVLRLSPRGSTMRRCGWSVGVGVASSWKSECNKMGTWNVRSLYKPGKIANVISEMKRMGVGIMGVAETFWDKEGSFTTELPGSDGGKNTGYFTPGGKETERGGYDCEGRGGEVCNNVRADLRQNYGNEVKDGSNKCAFSAGICTV
jgi:hypothetical protein